jgi:ComF family protein
VSIGFVHRECSDQTYLDGVFCMFMYDGLVKKIIYDVKYNYAYDVFKELGVTMGRFSLILPKFKDLVITSVPLSSQKFNLRGFNQAQILGRNISKFLGGRYLDFLKRTKNTKTQVGMDLFVRQTNLKNAFELKSVSTNMNFANIFIVDDVYTTGATLNECAKVIKSNYSVSVYGFTLARAPGGVIN